MWILSSIFGVASALWYYWYLANYTDHFDPDIHGKYEAEDRRITAVMVILVLAPLAGVLYMCYVGAVVFIEQAIEKGKTK